MKKFNLFAFVFLGILLTGSVGFSYQEVFAANGQIAFSSNRDGNFQIYVMNADGTGQTNISNNVATDTSPSWSPDGTQIAFQTNRDGNNEIYIMNADGTGQTNLSNTAGSENFPDWSPDGTQIVFYTARDGNDEIYIMNADGTGQTNISNNPARDQFPDWSPDGTKIVFNTNRDSGTGQIYTMNPDGTDPTRLTNISANDFNPSWSLDGTHILFTSNRDGNNDVFTMNPDGTVQTNISNDASSDLGWGWSPDGTKIVFTSTRVPIQQLYTMNADGTSVTRLTDNSANDFQADWGSNTSILDAIPPTLDSVITGPALDEITYTFSEDIDPLTVDDQVFAHVDNKSPASVSVSGNIVTVSFDGNFAIDFSDPSFLMFNPVQSVSDLAGNPTTSNFILPIDDGLAPTLDSAITGPRIDEITYAFGEFIDPSSISTSDFAHVDGKSPDSVYLDSPQNKIVVSFDGNFGIDFSEVSAERFAPGQSVSDFLGNPLTQGVGVTSVAIDDGLEPPTIRSVSTGPALNEITFLFSKVIAPGSLSPTDFADVDGKSPIGISGAPQDIIVSFDGNFATDFSEVSAERFAPGQSVSDTDGIILTQGIGTSHPILDNLGPIFTAQRNSVTEIELFFSEPTTILLHDPSLWSITDGGTVTGVSTVLSQFFVTISGMSDPNVEPTLTYSPTRGSSDVVDSVGNEMADGTNAVALDLIPPTVTFDTPSDGSTLPPFVTSLSGTNEAGATVSVIVNGAPPAAATPDTSTTWSLAVNLDVGSHTSSATATDTVGNIAIANSAFTVTVPTTAPDAPTGLTAEYLSSGQLQLTWDPPTDNGGSDIVQYVIEKFAPGLIQRYIPTTPHVGAQTDQQTTIIDVLPDDGLEYSHRIFADSFVGRSTPSNDATVWNTPPIIILDDTDYLLNHAAQITVTDPNAATSVSVTLTSTTDPVGISLTLSETSPGEFTSTVLVRLADVAASNPTTYLLDTVVGDTITASYVGFPTILDTANIVTPDTSDVPLIGGSQHGLTALICSNPLPGKYDSDVDGDSICDKWENSGDGSLTFSQSDDLMPGLGELGSDYVIDCLDFYGKADVDGNSVPDDLTKCPSDSKKDIFLEIDYMPGHRPSTAALDAVISAFDVQGINLHIILDDDDLDIHRDRITMLNENPGTQSFDALKEDYFGTSSERDDEVADGTGEVDGVLYAKRQAFHYAIFAHDFANDLGASGFAELGGNDLIVTLGLFTDSVGSVDQQASTLMHELGHNLELNHGGPHSIGASAQGADDNCKPNYLSVMNYAYQFKETIPKIERPIDFSAYGGVTYDLIENNGLNENTGFTSPNALWGEIRFGTPSGITTAATADGTGIDWNQVDGLTNPATANINYMPDISGKCVDSSTKTLESFDDWSALKYDFQNTGLWADGIIQPIDFIPEMTVGELTNNRESSVNSINDFIQGLHDGAFVSNPTQSRNTLDDAFSELLTLLDFNDIDNCTFAQTQITQIESLVNSLMVDSADRDSVLSSLSDLSDTFAISCDTGDASHDDTTTSRSTLDDLKTLLEEKLTGDIDKKTEKELEKAIKALEKSLDDKSWTDDNTLDSQHGMKVFDESKKAIKSLQKILKDNKETGDFNGEILDAISSIVESSADLASTALSDAIAFTGDKSQHEIDKAQGENAKIDKELSEEKYDKAVDHYKHQWQHSIKAIDDTMGEPEE